MTWKFSQVPLSPNCSFIAAGCGWILELDLLAGIERLALEVEIFVVPVVVRSFMSQRVQGIYPCSAPGWEIAGQQDCEDQHPRTADEC